MKPDQTRVGALLIDTVSLLCRNGLNFDSDVKVQGLLGITVDDNDVFLVHFNEILSEKQSSETHLVEVDAAVKPPSVTVSPSVQSDESFAGEKSDVRRTGYGSSTVLRHRYSNLPRDAQARRRVRHLGQHMKCQQEESTNDSVRVDINEGEKLECSNYPDIKTEAGENVFQNVSEDQEDVILVESEDGPIEHEQGISSFVKEEETSEISDENGKLMYSYGGSYVRMSSSTSEMAFGQEAGNLEGVASNVSYASDCDDDDDDVKPGIQMQSSCENWTEPDADWHSAESSLAAGSNYAHRSLSQQPNIPNSNRGSTFVGSRPRQRSIIVCPPNAVNQRRRDYVLMKCARRNDISSRWTSSTREHFEDGTASPNDRQASPSTTSFTHRRQMSQMPSAKMMYTVTKYVCNICDITFNHHCTLLTHQVRKHGRQKNARRGRPSAYSVP